MENNKKVTIIGNNERAERIKKLDLLKNSGIIPYAGKFDKKQNLLEIKSMEIGSQVQTAGRIILFRDMGRITFCHLQDFWGKTQVVFKEDILGKEKYRQIIKMLDIGDFIGISGETFNTNKGELSILVQNFSFLSKALRPLPEKWHGLKDLETMYRKRYLDFIMNEETRNRFKFRSDFVWELRNFYRDNGFDEIETPVLCNTPSGALAKPFKTHHNALNIDVFLRIAPEIYLKEAIIGGYEKIFEVARSFRNEGIDPSHLQDFTMVEHYSAYWDFEMNMDFTEKMLTTLISKLKGSLQIEIMNRDGEMVKVDFSFPWKRVSFRELLIEDCGIDIDKEETVEKLRLAIREKDISIDGMEKLGRGNLIDALYKEVSRKKMVNPVFLINHPIDVSPLARRNDDNPAITDRFQLVVNGWEIVNAYSELIDPIDQSQRFANQTQAREGGDEEAMMKDDEYVEAMEYGMPPISGWGMGIDRVVALLTQQANLRDVVMFPLLRPDANPDKTDE
ncbi:MAG: lysine--tRNA ligase [Candidatus Moranbacteria bacterium]|nr:lysine--tRNA ligase [Candidatus Moranbacteria bacterium]